MTPTKTSPDLFTRAGALARQARPGARRANWAIAATAAAALAACGGGGSDGPTTPANQAPSITLDLPAANTNYLSTDTVHITATAADADGTVAKVEFLSDGVKIGEDTTAPFAFDWVNPPVGPHTLTVRATDNAGATTVSASRTISSALNQAPTVSMSAPANNFKANAPTAVLLSANASDTDGTVAKVEFFKINPAAPVFDANTLVGQATAVGTPPSYQLTTAPLAAGTYNFVARATDNKGDTATSGSVQVIMNALPTVTITAPTAGGSIIPGTNFTLRATASDADGTISKVEFFLNGSTTPLGQATRVGTTNEYTLPWTAVTGAVSFTARATDNDGAATTTGSVAANVPPNVLPSVTLDNPTSARATAPTTLNLSASAADGDGSVTGVEFSYSLNGGAATKANGTLAAGKWTLAVPISALQSGTYAVTATATDNLGGKTTSPSKNVTIQANLAPAVNVTSSAAVTLDAGNAPKDITLTATASDPDNDGIAKVEFFNGATKLGEDTTAPYTFVWAGAAAGSYTITAKATDTVGSNTTSAAQTLVVTQNLLGPWNTLSTAQKAGITLTPDRAFGDPGNEAGAVMTAIGVNTVAPKYVAAMAQGLRRLADLPLAVTGTTLGSAVACPEGGTIGVFQLPAANERAIDLNNCKIGGFTFFGGGDNPVNQTYNTEAPDNKCTPNGNLPPSIPPALPLVCSWPSEVKFTGDANNYVIVVKTVQVSGNGTPEALGAPFPHNAYGYGWVRCTVTGGVKSCTTSHENSFVWGNDFNDPGWTNWSDNGTTAISTPLNQYATDDRYTLNGTLRPCQADPQPENQTITFCQDTPPAAFHIKFDGMAVDGKQPTPTGSGRAIVYGSANRWSVVTRQAQESAGIERMTVQQFSLTAGVVVPATPNPLPYRCTVDANGFYQCTSAP